MLKLPIPIKYLFTAYLAAVIIVSLIPLGGTSVAMNEHHVLSIRLDYLLHASVFLPLVPLWRLARPEHPWSLIILAGLLLAAVTEGSQYFIPYRAYNINDLLGNIAGVLLGVLVALAIQLFIRKPSAKQNIR